MVIEVIKNQEQWNVWLLSSSQPASFLQSWEWGDILLSEGKIVERLQVVEGGVVRAQAQIVFTQLPFGWQYGFCPGGPGVNVKCQMSNVKSNPNEQIYKLLLDYLKSKKCIFFRIEPPTLIHNSKFLILKSFDITPRATLIVDLTQSEDQLLAGMHEKTRYNIRLAQKKDLKIKRLPARPGSGSASGGKDLNNFWQLSGMTAERDGFRLHSKSHYQAILNSSLSHQVTIFQNDTPIASAIFVGFGKTFTYLFGASDHEYRNLMAPHLLQWEGIKLGKQLGFTRYDFFGIAPHQHNQNCHSERGLKADEESLSNSPTDRDFSPRCESGIRNDKFTYDPNHQYAKVTRFKLGFEGKPEESPGTYDLLISPSKYRIYQVLRKIRRLV